MTTTARKAPARRTKRPERGTLDHLEAALDELNKAREHAQKDARAQIDAAIERIRDVLRDAAAEFRRFNPHMGD